MALLFTDNFENWSSILSNYPGPWFRTAGTGSFNSGSTASNVNSATANTFQTTATSGISASLNLGFVATSTLVANMRVAFGTTAGTGNRAICVFYDGASEQCALVHKSNGYFAIFRGSATAELAQSVNSYPFNDTEYLDVEMKVTIHNTTGVIELRVNGGIEIASTGSLNTRGGTNNSADSVAMGAVTTPGISRPYFKHFVLMDTVGSQMNDFIGPVNVTSLRSSADGFYTNFTANTGNRWQAVDEAVTDADTTYVTASADGDKVTFGLTNLAAGVTDVLGVYAQAQVKREEATTRECKFLMRSAGVDQLGSKVLAVGPTYAFRSEAFGASPFTATNWTVAEVNGLELGMEIIT